MEIKDIKPVNGYCLIEPMDEVLEANAIFIPETHKKERPSYGKVVAVADEYITHKGDKMPIYVKPGDMVFFAAFSGDTIEIENKEYQLIELIYVKAIAKQ